MIRRATKEDISAIEAVFYDAICWMEQNHVPNLWTVANTRWNILEKSYNITDFFVYTIGEEIAGCMALTDADVQYWPDIPEGNAIYLHKLAVLRKYAGIGVSNKLIQYAKNVAIEQCVPAVRLDCSANQEKIRNLYERQGFQLTEIIPGADHYELALYVCDV